ncbi:precorrin-2 C(20)-methyltransferase [Heliobacterium undosum]|uniref:Precorrin-2 C(20)-methyltransferase n=1 Tax=Heliomicrobium undosum TaxID=121734 RepID=A0A845L8I7_9FIRM|nr:precorrin-2 C(20)-methyltransferase [Heliomicrobium undosum]MZP29241.1 precorrin-2 C(20)-methyltransferase [Heliomicrobium undosum]
MKGKFYGVGVGPGDPELLTLKAVRLLGAADAIIAPYSKKKGTGCAALAIVRDRLSPGAEVYELPIPRAYDEEKVEGACQAIIELLDTGKITVFISRGDPMLYSKYVHIARRLEERGYPVETVPGVVSFTAAACRAGFPLADEEESITIVPVDDEASNIEPALRKSESVVLLKVHKNLDRIIDLLEQYGFKNQAVLISRCGMSGELIEPDLEKLRGQKLTYLSTILAKKQARSNA